MKIFLLKRTLIFLLFLGLTFYFANTPIYAEITGVTEPRAVDENTATVNLIFSGLNPIKTYEILDRMQRIDGDGFRGITGVRTYTSPPVCGHDDGRLKSDCNTDFVTGDWFNWGDYRYIIREEGRGDTEKRFDFHVDRPIPPPDPPLIEPSNPHPFETIRVTLSGSKRAANESTRNDYEVIIDDLDAGARGIDKKTITIPPDDQATAEFSDGFVEGNYRLRIDDEGDDFLYYSVDFSIDADGGEVEPPVTGGDGDGGPPLEGRNPCEGGVCNTALGPISTDIGAFASQFLRIAIGLAGGIALIILVIGSIRVLTSSGDQQRLAGGRDMIIAAIAGLLFLIFSTLILRFIGVSILGGIV